VSKLLYAVEMCSYVPGAASDTPSPDLPGALHDLRDVPQVIDQPRKGYVSDYYVSCGGLCKVPACN
jgi:hypothetical protein